MPLLRPFIFIVIILPFPVTIPMTVAATESKTSITVTFADNPPAQVEVATGPVRIDDGWSIQSAPGTRQINVAGSTATTSFDLDQAVIYRLNHNGQSTSLFLSPGDNLTVHVDQKIRFSGDGAGSNQLLSEVGNLLFQAEQSLATDTSALYVKLPNAFLEALNDRKTDTLEAYSQLTIEQPVTEAARVWAEAQINYRFGLFLLLYPVVHESITHQRPALPGDFFAALDIIDINNAGALNAPDFVRYLDKYVDVMGAREDNFNALFGPQERLHTRYENIRKLSVDTGIKNYLFAQMFNDFQTSYGVKDWQPVFERYSTDYGNTPLARSIASDQFEAEKQRRKPDSIEIYRRVDGIQLEAHIFFPKQHSQPGKAAYLFFHGGGWAIGSPEWGYRESERMAALGMLAITFEYRLIDVHGSDIPNAVDDVRAAIVWVREQAEGWGVDPEKVVAAGFSAGAHLAGTTAMLEGFDTSIASSDGRPNALIMQSSSYDLSKNDWFRTVSRGRPESVSLQHNVSAGLPPTLLIHGSRDHLAPLQEFTAFTDLIKATNPDTEVHLLSGVGHFFREGDASSQASALKEKFLHKLGYVIQSGQ